MWQKTAVVGRGVWLTGVDSTTITRPRNCSYLSASCRVHTSDKTRLVALPRYTGLVPASSHSRAGKTLADSSRRKTSPGSHHQAPGVPTVPPSANKPGKLSLHKTPCGIIHQQGNSLFRRPSSLFNSSSKLSYPGKTLDISVSNYNTRVASFCSERPSTGDDHSDDMKAFQIVVKTGDQEGAGTDANVHVVLEDEKGLLTPRLKLDKILYNDLERSKRDTYNVDCPEDFGKVVRLRLSRDTTGIADDWFCDYIHVEDRRKAPMKKIAKNQTSKSIRNFLGSTYLKENVAEEKGVYFFPIHRWVAPEHNYLFDEYATCLPQHDPCLEPRKSDLAKKKSSYSYIVRAEGLVAQVRGILSHSSKHSMMLINNRR